MDTESSKKMEVAGSETFFEHWAIYRKVILFNYMGHDQIAATMTRYLSSQSPIGSILDLGCGDAEIPSRYLPALTVNEYHGVDLAAKPLEFARKKLAGFPGSLHFYQQDQARFLAALDRSFDLIVFGFALHHNTREEKAAVLADAARCLNPGGTLLVYDVFRDPGETREAYFDRYLEWVRQDWQAMTDREQELIDAHIRANDHPASLAELYESAERAGLGQVALLRTACRGFHHLLRFTR